MAGGGEVSSHFVCVPWHSWRGGVFGNMRCGSRGCGPSRWMNLNQSSACVRCFYDWGGVSLDWFFGRVDMAARDGALDERHGFHGWIGLCCDQYRTGFGCRVMVK